MRLALADDGTVPFGRGHAELPAVGAGQPVPLDERLELTPHTLLPLRHTPRLTSSAGTCAGRALCLRVARRLLVAGQAAGNSSLAGITAQFLCDLAADTPAGDLPVHLVRFLLQSHDPLPELDGTGFEGAQSARHDSSGRGHSRCSGPGTEDTTTLHPPQRSQTANMQLRHLIMENQLAVPPGCPRRSAELRSRVADRIKAWLPVFRGQLQIRIGMPVRMTAARSLPGRPRRSVARTESTGTGGDASELRGRARSRRSRTRWYPAPGGCAPRPDRPTV